jgi:flagellin-specific chaperone FliS
MKNNFFSLLEKDKFAQAQAVLVRYQRQVDSLVLKVNSENASELKDKLVSLFDQQIEQIKVLTSIEKSLLDTQPQLLNTVRELRQQALEKLMGAFEKLEGDLPLSMIQELRDLLQTYVSNGVYDRNFVLLLNRMLLKFGKNLPGSGKLPSELGLVTLIEDEATPPVRSKSMLHNAAGGSSTQQTNLGTCVTQECD